MNCVEGLLTHFKVLEKDFHLHYAEVMKHFLAMNFLALAYTMIVLGSWVRAKLSE